VQNVLVVEVREAGGVTVKRRCADCHAWERHPNPLYSAWGACDTFHFTETRPNDGKDCDKFAPKPAASADLFAAPEE